MVDRTLRIIAGILVGFSLILMGFGVFAARLAVYPWWYKKDSIGVRLTPCEAYQKQVWVYCEDPKKSLGLDYVSFENAFQVSGHATRVVGWWVPAVPRSPRQPGPVGTVILVHGAGADRRSMLKHVPYLHAAGYEVLLMDAWNHGLNGGDGRGISYGYRESESLEAAVDWVSKRGLAGPIYVLGTSQGAFSALLAAAYTPAIHAVVAENPYVSVPRLLLEFHALEWMPNVSKQLGLWLLGLWIKESPYDLDVREFADRVTQPVLLIHGDLDITVNVQQSREIAALLKNPKSSLWVIPGGEHEALWNFAKAEYEARVLLFLRSNP